jgi:phage terminase large subunit-like protein
MLTGLLAKLRAQYPAAHIVMTVARAFAPLYAGKPYGVVAHPFDPRDFATFRELLAMPRFDLAILPADNRWSWLARAIVRALDRRAGGRSAGAQELAGRRSHCLLARAHGLLRDGGGARGGSLRRSPIERPRGPRPPPMRRNSKAITQCCTSARRRR